MRQASSRWPVVVHSRVGWMSATRSLEHGGERGCAAARRSLSAPGWTTCRCRAECSFDEQHRTAHAPTLNPRPSHSYPSPAPLLAPPLASHWPCVPLCTHHIATTLHAHLGLNRALLFTFVLAYNFFQLISPSQCIVLIAQTIRRLAAERWGAQPCAG